MSDNPLRHFKSDLDYEYQHECKTCGGPVIGDDTHCDSCTHLVVDAIDAAEIEYTPEALEILVFTLERQKKMLIDRLKSIEDRLNHINFVESIAESMIQAIALAKEAKNEIKN